MQLSGTLLLKQVHPAKMKLQAEVDGFYFYRQVTCTIAANDKKPAEGIYADEFDVIDISIAPDPFYPFMIQLLVNAGFCRINISSKIKFCIPADLINDLFTE